MEAERRQARGVFGLGLNVLTPSLITCSYRFQSRGTTYHEDSSCVCFTELAWLSTGSGVQKCRCIAHWTGNVPGLQFEVQNCGSLFTLMTDPWRPSTLIPFALSCRTVWRFLNVMPSDVLFWFIYALCNGPPGISNDWHWVLVRALLLVSALLTFTTCVCFAGSLSPLLDFVCWHEPGKVNAAEPPPCFYGGRAHIHTRVHEWLGREAENSYFGAT